MRRYRTSYKDTYDPAPALWPDASGPWVRYSDVAALRQQLADALRYTRALQRQVDHALEIRAEDVAALVEAAYREGWRAGYVAPGLGPPATHVEANWTDSKARAALARKEETPDAP